jgi:hypothetical protein
MLLTVKCALSIETRGIEEGLVCSDRTDAAPSDRRRYVQEQAQLLSLLSVDECAVFLWMLNKGSAVIF